MTTGSRLLSCVVLVSAASAAMAQHLWWKPKAGDRPFTCVYGEIEVLATNQYIYFCGCNWWPGKPAGGYTGIQDQGNGRHNMIFSIWDTSPTLHPKVTEADNKAMFNRFGGEGTGAHTHLDYHWEPGKTYRFYVTKEQDAAHANTLTRLYFKDDQTGKWVHEATISNPNNGSVSVETFGGGLNAFLENWMGREKQLPKLAAYRLWMGSSPKDLVNVTTGTGDGNWGALNGTFYLAEGDESALQPIFDRAKGRGSVVRGGKRGDILTVPERRVPPSIVRQLEKLPRSKTVE